jgi:hypothetical protein
MKWIFLLSGTLLSFGLSYVVGKKILKQNHYPHYEERIMCHDERCRHCGAI